MKCLASAVLLLSLCALPLWSAETITSHLGHQGPAFAPGMTPNALGWGPDDQPYPDKFVVNPQDGAEMAWVPPGRFRMGTSSEEIELVWKENGWDPDWKQYTHEEQPAHQVVLTHGLWLYRETVTNGQYGRFLAATGHRPGDQWGECKDQTNLPVVLVTWDDAGAYAAWAGGALPTEAQWEWSARGAEGRLYPWGNQWDRERCNGAEYWAKAPLKDGGSWGTWFLGLEGSGLSQVLEHLRPVGSFPGGASWCGALDMAGNVWQWCADWYDEGYYARSPGDDPPGPARGTKRLLRGGSWNNGPEECRSAKRHRQTPGAMASNCGFRCARTP